MEWILVALVVWWVVRSLRDNEARELEHELERIRQDQAELERFFAEGQWAHDPADRAARRYATERRAVERRLRLLKGGRDG